MTCQFFFMEHCERKEVAPVDISKIPALVAMVANANAGAVLYFSFFIPVGED